MRVSVNHSSIAMSSIPNTGRSILVTHAKIECNLCTSHFHHAGQTPERSSILRNFKIHCFSTKKARIKYKFGAKNPKQLHSYSVFTQCTLYGYARFSIRFDCRCVRCTIVSVCLLSCRVCFRFVIYSREFSFRFAFGWHTPSILLFSYAALIFHINSCVSLSFAIILLHLFYDER